MVKDSVKLHLPAMQELQSCYIECYTDTAFGNLPDNGSQGGTIIFLIGSSSSKSFRYVGLNIVSKGEGIMVDQLQYASSLQTISINKARSSNKLCELSEIEKNEYRALVGQLNWLAANTRPDISFDICELSVST